MGGKVRIELALISACREIFSGCEIERRPRGASRINPLLHLFRASYFCTIDARTLGAWQVIRGAAAAITSITNGTNKADSSDLTGGTGPKQM